MIHFQVIPRENVTFENESTLQEYSHTPNNYRGFCSKCGSSIYWRTDNFFEILTGTLDKDVLVSEDGTKLCMPTGGRFFCGQAVPGVTTPDGMFGGGIGNKKFGKRWAGDYAPAPMDKDEDE